MKIFFILFLIVCLAMPSYCNNFDSKWKKIIPLVSTCNDIKKIFRVKSCDFPDSYYKLPGYVITVTFSTGRDKWKVAKGTVLEVGISLQKLINLEDYEKDLTNYEVLPESDLPDYRRYVNQAKGIELLVTKDKFIQHILIYPPSK